MTNASPIIKWALIIGALVAALIAQNCVADKEILFALFMATPAITIIGALLLVSDEKGGKA